jgi:hypothetical protein
VGFSRPDEYRHQERGTDTFLVQLCVYAVLYSTVLVPERLVVAGHDGSDFPVVLAVDTMDRQSLCMELMPTLHDNPV